MGCVYLVRVYYLHIVCIVCALSYEPQALYVCAVAESRTLLVQSRHHSTPKSPEQNFACFAMKLKKKNTSCFRPQNICFPAGFIRSYCISPGFSTG